MGSVCRCVVKIWRKPGCRLVLAAVFSACLGVLASRMFIGSVAVVEGKSMMPNYPPGIHLYAAPISTPLERGDVVLLDDGNDDYAVKRIVGLPGETVQVWRGCVFINRKLLVEPYLPAHTYTFPVERERRGATFILGEDEYFVLGDNRSISADSRSYGPVHRHRIKKRVPMPQDFVCAYFGHYTLPEPGGTVIRPLDQHPAGPSPF
ncbi:MAG TPA: signal peptidase I [Candidatus Acidoferrum sp.]|nr:signal peptidase I [Candidatus Acidoferrum sp.]